ncbi:MAG: hypothetical protein ABI268_12380 [Rhodanobacter sp.]
MPLQRRLSWRSSYIGAFPRAELGNRDGHPPTQLPVRLLEKTPKNALRVPFMTKVFQEAGLAYLSRDPRQLLSSMLISIELLHPRLEETIKRASRFAARVPVRRMTPCQARLHLAFSRGPLSCTDPPRRYATMARR